MGATRAAALSAEVSYEQPAGAERNVVNGGEAVLSFVEVEMKSFPGWDAFSRRSRCRHPW